MQQYTGLKAETPEDDVGLALVVDAELFRIEAIVRWLDAADARLKRLPQVVATRPPAAPGPAVRKPAVRKPAVRMPAVRKATGSRR
jgi:hypothetical protein